MYLGVVVAVVFLLLFLVACDFNINGLVFRQFDAVMLPRFLVFIANFFKKGVATVYCIILRMFGNQQAYYNGRSE